MYTIGKVLEGIILTCQDCTHIERVSQFNPNLGNQRTQAAQAMQKHSRAKHNAGPLLNPPEEIRSDGTVVGLK